MASLTQVPCEKLFSRIHTPPKEKLIHIIESVIGQGGVVDLDVEFCYHFELSPTLKEEGSPFPGFTTEESKKLVWLFGETFLLDLSSSSLLQKEHKDAQVLELGPRLNFSTAFSTNGVCICQSCGLSRVQRVEKSRRLWVQTTPDLKFEALDKNVYQQLLSALHDPMTECVYESPLTSLTSTLAPEGWFEVPVMEEGEQALKDINQKNGFGWDDADLAYYYNLFANILKRNPTNVECFDLSQSNSEHSRHWFFKGKMVIDGEEQPHTLLELVMNTLKAHPTNSVLAFCDNSSTIRGKEVDVLISRDPSISSMIDKVTVDRDLLFTAETHNFPTGVAPFPGAETGVGGRIRDTHATGRGSLVVAGTAGYSVGNLHVPGYPLAWEGEDVCPTVHSKFADPLQVIIEASDGASDYGNKFGEPLINGFCRSVGMVVEGEQREFLKPIMFSAGIGQMDHAHAKKGAPKPEMKVIKLGGPCYRIGVGGGAASSTIQGKNDEELDFQAVQRGDAEMEQKVNRVIRACVELGEKNPIVSIHDQGAGGNGNVLKEIVEPAGGKFEVRNLLLGDKSLSVLEIWGAEYQENDALLLQNSPSDLELFDQICKREGALYSVVGEVTGDGYVTLHDKIDDSTPFNLHLDHVLGKMPQKTFKSERKTLSLPPFEIPLSKGVEAPKDLSWAGKISEMLDRVLRLLGVGSKRFLTTKVDRSVTGLVAQQQCVGPLHLPLANCGVVAFSHADKSGGVTAIGEQPVKGLVNPQAMGRLCVGEMLTNICWCYLPGGLTSIKCSGNWMWPAKLPNEDASLFDTCVAMCKLMEEVGVAVDGGKDSLSMASKGVDSKGNSCFVKCPGTLVVSGYAVCDDVTKKVTPDLKGNGSSSILLIDIGQGKNRMGGSSLSQVYGSVGGPSVPDVDNPSLLINTFNVVQTLVKEGLIVAGHDRSDGGLITTLLEMSFSGNCGLICSLSFPSSSSSPSSLFAGLVEGLFSEELGVVVEVMDKCRNKVEAILSSLSVPFVEVGRTTSEDRVVFTATLGESQEKVIVLDEKMTKMRDVWEATGFELEKKQANPVCVNQEQQGLSSRSCPPYSLSFSPAPLPEGKPCHSVAVLREEGSNGDREMAAAFYHAGFNVRDVTMSDLVSKKVSLSEFRGLAFVGGFSFADVLGSAKGWGAQLKFSNLMDELKEFFVRKDTFSIGICNGCQLMALLGLSPFFELEEKKKPRFLGNESGRFESRFTTLRVEKGTPSIFFKGMEGSVLGCWSSHGEGRAYFPDEAILQEIMEKNLAPIRYVDDQGEPTQAYPFNPNGSTNAIAGLCSVDGRHTAIMPHPERTCFPWSWPHIPSNLQKEFDAQSPWMRMFHNARLWCDEE